MFFEKQRHTVSEKQKLRPLRGFLVFWSWCFVLKPLIYGYYISISLLQSVKDALTLSTPHLTYQLCLFFPCIPPFFISPNTPVTSLKHMLALLHSQEVKSFADCCRSIMKPFLCKKKSITQLPQIMALARKTRVSLCVTNSSLFCSGA